MMTPAYRERVTERLKKIVLDCSPADAEEAHADAFAERVARHLCSSVETEIAWFESGWIAKDGTLAVPEPVMKERCERKDRKEPLPQHDYQKGERVFYYHGPDSEWREGKIVKADRRDRFNPTVDVLDKGTSAIYRVGVREVRREAP